MCVETVGSGEGPGVGCEPHLRGDSSWELFLLSSLWDLVPDEVQGVVGKKSRGKPPGALLRWVLGQSEYQHGTESWK